MSIDSELIDQCISYIEDKDCSYLAKEGTIVNYMSFTGRKSDYIWHRHTIMETLRIIRAMRLTSDQARDLKERHLISAFQELARVYEFGVKSRHTVADGIFNYSQHSEMSLGDEAMSMLVEALQMQGFRGLILMEVVELYNEIDRKLNLKLSTTEKRDLMCKHFECAGFIIKTGAHRPMIYGKKQPAIMQEGVKPSEVSFIPSLLCSKFVNKIFGELV
jgi:hypothetical protein